VIFRAKGRFAALRVFPDDGKAFWRIPQTLAFVSLAAYAFTLWTFINCRNLDARGEQL
jgi:hypothetical protein